MLFADVVGFTAAVLIPVVPPSASNPSIGKGPVNLKWSFVGKARGG
jgi:hypothetical protein